MGGPSVMWTSKGGSDDAEGARDTAQHQYMANESILQDIYDVT